MPRDQSQRETSTGNAGDVEALVNRWIGDRGCCCVRPSSVMYLIDMLLRRQTWGSFVPVIIIVEVL